MCLSAGISLLIIPEIKFSSNFTGAIEFNDGMSAFVKDRLIEQISAAPFLSLLTSTIQSIGMAWSFGMLFALGEEIGWRGYMVDITEKFGFWKSVFIIGPIWGFWHFPLILNGYNFPSNPELGVLMMMLACTSLTPIMIFLRRKTKSIWGPAIFHGSFNNLSFLSLAPLNGQATSFSVGFLGFSGIIASFILFFILKKITKED